MKIQTANRTRRVTISPLALMLTLWSSAGPAGALPDEVDLVLRVWGGVAIRSYRSYVDLAPLAP